VIGVGAVAAAYLLGSIPFGLVVGRLVRGVDVRREGSGNIGATNVARSLGVWAGILTLALDLGKGTAAVWLGRCISGSEVWPAATGLASLVGHIYPLYLRFRGGKGVATGCGVFLALTPVATLGAAAIFAVVVLATRRVSTGSILASASLPLILLEAKAAPILVTASLFSSALIVFRHSENIRRILSGTEPSLGKGKR